MKYLHFGHRANITLKMPESGITKRQILVVDDEKDLRELLQENLEDAGFVCFTASSGRDALRVFAAEEIDLAVVDIMMPGMSGVDLFTRIKEEYPRVAVLFVSAENRMDVAVSQIKEGALDYLVKPVEKAELIKAVNEAMEKQSAYLENFVHQQHLEELLVHQSKALENKIREVEVLNQKVAGLPAQTGIPDSGALREPPKTS